MSLQESSSTPLPESLDIYKSIMEDGLTPGGKPPLYPTLVIETDDEMQVAVLDRAPEFKDVFEVVMQWKRAVLEDQESTQLHGVGFVASAGEITLGVFPPDEGIWFAGRVSATTGSIEWRPNDKLR